MIKAVIFDFAGVVVPDVYWNWLETNVPDIARKREYFEKLSYDADRNIISTEEFEEGIAKETSLKQEEVWTIFREHFLANKDLLALIKNLKHKYKIGLLSNFTHGWIEELISIHNLQEYFDEILISSDHKIAKPEPAFFKKAVELLRVRPEEAVFFDDRQENVDAGNALGIKSFLYTDLAGFKKDLSSVGVR